MSATDPTTAGEPSAAGPPGQHTVRSGAVALSVEDSGSGPPIVLLHGLTATRRYVVMGSTLLQRSGHRVLAYDARGHGRSAPAPTSDAYAYSDLSDDLRAVLDALGIERAVLAGASMGAHTALRFALESPERVAALAVITPAYLPGAERDQGALARWSRLAAGLRTGGIEGFIAAYGTPRADPRWRATVETVIRQRLATHEHLAAVADALEAVPRSAPFERWEELGALATIPSIVIADRDESDPEHPLATGERYAAAIPGAYMIVEDPGKSPIAWQGAQLSRLLLELAARADLANRQV